MPESGPKFSIGTDSTNLIGGKARGKILKAAWASLLQKQSEQKKREREQIFGDASDFPEEHPGQEKEPEPEFQPMTFMSRKSGKGPATVVMIPASDSQMEELEENVEFGEGSEFQVAQSPMVPAVDVEAIIAEAEQKGREKAQKIIEHAQAEAKKLIDQAKIYGETAKQEAHAEGLKLGKEDGYKAGLEEFSSYMNEAKNLFTQLVREREQVLSGIEPELARLSISIAEKIIGSELDINQDAVINIIRNAMSKIKSREEVTIKVSPDDLDYVRENKDVFARMVEGLKNLEIISDPRVDRGGCMIETNLGNADARITTQLSTLELAFKKLENPGL